MNRLEKAGLATAIALAVLLFNIFNILPPIPRITPSLGGVGEASTLDFARVLRVEVEWLEAMQPAGTGRPVQSLLVRVGDLAALTNRDGVAELRVPRGVHRVVISSPLSLLPTWLTDVEVEGVEVILKVRYREFRQGLTGLAVSVDHASRTSTVQASYSLPATNSSFHYVGTPVIFFVDQSLYMRAFKGDAVYEWFTAMHRPYQGPFKTVLADYQAEERVVVEGLILYVSLQESYVPVFDVEAEMVVKS